MPPWVWPWTISGLMARPTSSTRACSARSRPRRSPDPPRPRTPRSRTGRTACSPSRRTRPRGARAGRPARRAGAAAAATAKRSTARSVPRTRKRRSRELHVLHRRLEQPRREPARPAPRGGPRPWPSPRRPGAWSGRSASRRPPATRSVSPAIRRTWSGSTPSHSAMSWGKRGLVALAGRERADDHVDPTPSGPHGDLRPLARRAGGDLDVVGEADAAVAPAPARLRAARLEAGPVGQRHARGPARPA